MNIYILFLTVIFKQLKCDNLLDFQC